MEQRRVKSTTSPSSILAKNNSPFLISTSYFLIVFTKKHDLEKSNTLFKEPQPCWGIILFFMRTYFCPNLNCPIISILSILQQFPLLWSLIRPRLQREGRYVGTLGQCSPALHGSVLKVEYVGEPSCITWSGGVRGHTNCLNHPIKMILGQF